MARKTVALEATGFKELDAFLGTVPDREIKKTMRKGTRAAAKVVLKDAIEFAPEDEGLLKSTAVVRTARGPGGKKLPRGTIGHSVQHRNPTETWYARFQQWGSKFIKNPSRYITEALYRNEREVVAVSAKVMRADMKRLAKLGRQQVK